MKLTVLGSTGSIGKNTLDVVALHPDRYQVVALTAHSNWELLLEQCQRFKPQYAVVLREQAAEQLTNAIHESGLATEVLYGPKALEQVATLETVDTVMAAIVGAAGLLPTFAAVQSGKRILLANKEALVMAGELFMREAKKRHAEIIPVDSEHNAIFQCMPSGFMPGMLPLGVQSITLTASGGPFLTTPLDQLPSITPEQACAHPKWVMGKKISVDSATMMNKGLEVIEAHWLFGMPPEKIKVVIHPQSIVHSMVSFKDGSSLAQLGPPDMRVPIATALAWPERIASNVQSLDLTKVSKLEFLPLDLNRFPALSLAYQALKAGGTASTYLNAANEIAVEAFLAGKIAYLDIAKTVETVMNKLVASSASTLEEILAADQLAREMAKEWTEESNLVS